MIHYRILSNKYEVISQIWADMHEFDYNVNTIKLYKNDEIIALYLNIGGFEIMRKPK